MNKAADSLKKSTAYCATSDSHYNPVASFLEAMAAAGVAPSDGGIVADGTLRRYRVTGDKPGSRNGYYLLHLDGIPAGCFGSWKAGISQTWSAKRTDDMTAAERIKHYERIEQAQRAARLEREQAASEAAARAASEWETAKPAPENHPYLVRKGIRPGIARQDKGGRLLLPVTGFDGRIKTVQRISPDGDKRFMTGGAKKGGFVLVQGQPEVAQVVICEGWATGMTIAADQPWALVLAALDAGNLEPVARVARHRWPWAQVVIAGDDDRTTPGNPGRRFAEDAAFTCRVKVIFPNFPPEAPQSLSDFNDLAQWKRQGGGV